jgi:magnesium-protoporphyrin O-methyltransferase
MSCCSQCTGIEDVFDEKSAQEELRDYRRNGPAGETRWLIAAIREAGISPEMSLLDVGGGAGAIQHELAETTTGRITNVDASSSFLRVAREEAQKRGYAGRADYHHGDFVALAPHLEPADIVTLDRVICCYHDMTGLVQAATGRAGRYLGLVYPRDNWYVRPFFTLLNLTMRLRGSLFRVFLHANQQVDELVRAAGFQPIFHRHSLAWRVDLYARPV